MTRFTHWFPPQQVLFGRDTVMELHEPLAELGIERPMVVCSPRARRDPSFERFAARLPPGARIWAGAEAHAPLRCAIAGAEVAHEHGADGLVSFGGGSTSDLAKGIALALVHGANIEAFALQRSGGVATSRLDVSSVLPLVALPTTLSGAEVTPGFSLTRSDAYKLVFRDRALAARLVVLDPLLIEQTPNDVLIGSGMNAVAHCCEALYSGARTPISTLFATEGLRLLWRGLEGRLGAQDSVDDLLLGAYFAAAAIVNARTALHHAICHKLAPLARSSHGDANTAILPYALSFNLEACPEQARQIAAAIGVAAESDVDRIGTIAECVRDLARRAGLRTRLREFDLADADLDELARRVFGEPGLAFNPRHIESPAQIRALLRSAW